MKKRSKGESFDKFHRWHFSLNDLKTYLDKIQTKTLLAYGVYQIEADGLNLFDYIKGDRDSIMGLPIAQIKDYINNYKK